MRQFEKDIIAIIKRVLDKSEQVISENFSFDECYKLANEQQLHALLFIGLKDETRFREHKIYNCFKNTCQESVANGITIGYEVEQISREFLEKNIDFSLLKGLKLKLLYPDDILRFMGDADILIRTEQYPKIKEIMIKLGFEEDIESAHEFVWKKDKVVIELHKSLIPNYNKDYYAYFGDGWDYLEKRDGTTQYEFSIEKNYVYLYTHFAKHYRDAGAGIKYILDFYIYKKSFPNMDFSIIEAELKKLKLFEFYKNIERLQKVWFYGQESDDKTDFLTEQIFANKVYGSRENAIVAKQLKISKTHKNHKFFYFVSFVFPSAKKLQYKYKILKKCPFLLPFIWIIRGIGGIFKPKKAIITMKRIKNIKQEEVNLYQQYLNFVGLDYNFED